MVLIHLGLACDVVTSLAVILFTFGMFGDKGICIHHEEILLLVNG